MTLNERLLKGNLVIKLLNFGIFVFVFF